MVLLHGVFTSRDVSIGNFEKWSGKKTATITKFANTDDLDASSYFKNQIRPIWKYGHVPLLTLEPWCGENVERKTINGNLEGMWNSWADAIQAYVSHDEHAKLYIRLAHEMNGDWYPWSKNPGAYKKMWRHVRKKIVNRSGVNRRNVQFIFCANSDDTTGNRIEEFYPGDEHVDWVAVDGYNFGSKRDWSSWRSPGETFNDMLRRVRNVSGGKPVVIPETGTTAEKNGSMRRGAKNAWIHNLYEWADRKDIGMLNYFNVDKTTKWEKGKRTMDWSVFGYGERYDAYKDEVTKGRVVAPGGDERLTYDQFSGNL